jgi:hypothetical protein
MLRSLAGIALVALFAVLGSVPAFSQAATLYDLDANLANASVPIAISTATTTQLVAAPSGTEPGGGGQSIYISGFDFWAAGSGAIQLVYGTGTNCSTGQGNVTGNYSFIAQTGLSVGGGFGPVAVVPAGNALCAVTSEAVSIAGALSYRVR